MPIIMEGTPPLTGRALPNLINAVSILKSKSKSTSKLRCFDFDFYILTAFIRLGRARPEGAGCPPILKGLGRVPSIIRRILFSLILGLLLSLTGEQLK